MKVGGQITSMEASVRGNELVTRHNETVIMLRA